MNTKVRWIVQNPPPGDDSPTRALLERACDSLGLPFATIDVKAFTGKVFAPDELVALRTRLESRGRIRGTDTIVVAPVREIDAEARTFVVEGRVVGGSFYRPDDSPRLPADLIAFVEEAARMGSPAPVFVLDVARVDGAYRIVETNCMNGSRFYGADVRAIVDAISAFQARRWSAAGEL